MKDLQNLLPHGQTLKDAYKRPLLRNWSLLIIECTLIPFLFMAAPFYWYVIQELPVRRSDWYSLFDHLMVKGQGFIWQVEGTRWLMFTLHLFLQMVLTRRVSLLVPQVAAAWTKWTSSLNLKESSITAAASWTEVLVDCSGYLFNLVSCVSLYFLSKHLFAYDPNARTWQYFLQCTVLLATLFSAGLAIEKMILHKLVIDFQRTIYQERVYKCMWAGWVVKTIRSYISNQRQQGGQEKSSWRPRAFPFRPNSDLLAAFMLESASVRGQKKQSVEEISAFFDGIIEEHHLVKVFGDVDVAKKAYSMLSEGLNGNNNDALLKATTPLIDRELLSTSIGSIYKERQDLMRALRTHAKIITKLDRVMLAFAFGLILYFGALPIFGYSDLNGFLGLSLVPSIIYFAKFLGKIVQPLCEAIVYIVSSHPYDIGDRITMDGVDFFVHEVGLISTTFKRFDGHMVYIPNYILRKKVVLNVRRSGPQAHRLEILIDMKTPLTSVQGVADRMKQFIRSESRDFDSLISTFYELRPESNHLALVFLLRHRLNFQDGVLRAERVNKFLLHLKGVMAEEHLNYQPPVFRAILDGDLELSRRSDRILV